MTMDQLRKLSDERRRALLTLETLRTESANMSILDAQLRQVEKVLQVMSKTEDIRDQCIQEVCKSRQCDDDQSRKIEELQNVVAILEAKILLQDTRLRDIETKQKEPREANGNGDVTVTKVETHQVGVGRKDARHRTTSATSDVVDSSYSRRGSGSSTNSGVIMFAAAVEGVKELAPYHQRPADAFKERVRRLSTDAAFETQAKVKAAEEVENQGGTDMEVDWRSNKTVFKPEAPEFRPRNIVVNEKVPVAVADVTSSYAKQPSAPEVQEPLELEPPKFFKPRLTNNSAPVNTTPQPALSEKSVVEQQKDTVMPNSPEQNSMDSFETEVRSWNVERDSIEIQDAAALSNNKPAESPQQAKGSNINEAMSRSTEDDEEIHPDEALIRDAFLKPMFEESVGVFTAIHSFLGKIEGQADDVEWVPFMKVMTELAIETRAKAAKGLEIYEILVDAIGEAYLRKPLLQRCQKLFQQVLKAVENNYIDHDYLEATLWFLARLYYWENFGQRREVLGLAVCELLSKLARMTVHSMSIADRLTTIKELLAFMADRLKNDVVYPKLEEQILNISEGVVAQLSTFGPRMYKEQELARNILKYVDSLVKKSVDVDENVDWV